MSIATKLVFELIDGSLDPTGEIISRKKNGNVVFE